MRRSTAFLLTGLVAGAGLFGAWRWDRAREAEREAAVETSQVRAWARTEGGAGLSVLPKRVPAADPDELRRFEDQPGFHTFAMRCSSCHELPDPGAYPARRWIGKVAEMQEHVDRAGLMPPTREELAAVVEFLGQASGSLR